MAKKGLAMWVMSKLVIMIFLFTLVGMMFAFKEINARKTGIDTLRSYNALLAELASNAAFTGSNNYIQAVPLVRAIELEDEFKEYTLVVRKIGEGRVIFLTAWMTYGDWKNITHYDSAAALYLPPSIKEVWLYDCARSTTGEFKRLCTKLPFGEDYLLLKPSAPAESDGHRVLVFHKKKDENGITRFCIYRVVDSTTAPLGTDLSGFINRQISNLCDPLHQNG